MDLEQVVCSECQNTFVRMPPNKDEFILFELCDDCRAERKSSNSIADQVSIRMGGITQQELLDKFN